ncbi:MAG: hypothetical protein H6R18_159 [Proteobacteria bacterium]|nr:hypothetical protein [Pseudomonadota bacterium]
MTLPSLFISHGSPEFAFQPGKLGAALGQLGKSLPKPRAVVLMSPHWMTSQLQVQTTAAPSTVHDFGGFSPALFEIDYPAAGAPEIAAQVLQRLAQAGIVATANDHAGRDHGVWVPMLHMYPEADVPVLQIAQTVADQPQTLLALGRALAPLRAEGVLIVGSGGVTHNLNDFRSAAAGEYVQPFADWLAGRIAAADLEALLDYRWQAPFAKRAHPTEEHLLSLFFAIGAAGDDWTRSCRIEGGVADNVLVMDSYIFGGD